jgi:hypothetical protein
MVGALEEGKNASYQLEQEARRRSARLLAIVASGVLVGCSTLTPQIFSKRFDAAASCAGTGGDQKPAAAASGGDPSFAARREPALRPDRGPRARRRHGRCTRRPHRADAVRARRIFARQRAGSALAALDAAELEPLVEELDWPAGDCGSIPGDSGAALWDENDHLVAINVGSVTRVWRSACCTRSGSRCRSSEPARITCYWVGTR